MKKLRIILTVSVIIVAVAAAAFYTAVNKGFDYISGALLEYVANEDKDTDSPQTAAPTETDGKQSDTAQTADKQTSGKQPSANETPKATSKPSLATKLRSMSKEQIEKLSKDMSVSDKMAILQIVRSSLPQDEMSRLMKLFKNGGVSSENIKEAENAVRANLSREQIEEIKTYIDKYTE